MQDPRIDVGNTGWVTLRFSPDDPPDVDLLRSWIVESYRTLAPKALARQVEGD